MKHLLINIAFLFYLLSLSTVANAEEFRVSPDEFAAFNYDQNGLVLQYFNFTMEPAYFGGQKANLKFTGYNKNAKSVNYTVYIVAFDAADKVVCAFSFEPSANTHPPQDARNYSVSGMIATDIEQKIMIEYFIIKVVRQNIS